LSASFLKDLESTFEEELKEDRAADTAEKENQDAPCPSNQVYRLCNVFAHTKRYNGGGSKPLIPDHLPFRNIFELATKPGISDEKPSELATPIFQNYRDAQGPLPGEHPHIRSSCWPASLRVENSAHCWQEKSDLTRETSTIFISN
jgi:hypothetical protein